MKKHLFIKAMLTMIVIFSFATVLTAQVIDTFPWIEDFNWIGGTTYLPGGWYRPPAMTAPGFTYPSGTYTPDYNANPVSTTWSASSTTYFANSNANHPFKISIRNAMAINHRLWLITPVIDLGTEPHNNWLFFDIAKTTNAGEFAAGHADDMIAVVISTDGGATFSATNTLVRFHNGTFTDSFDKSFNAISTTGDRIAADLSSYSGKVRIGFYRHTGGTTVTSNNISLDNVTITPRDIIHPLDFGRQMTNETNKKTFIISNYTTSPITINSYSITGPNYMRFIEVPAESELGGTIPPLGYGHITLEFTPAVMGITNASLDLSLEGGSTLSIPIIGNWWDGLITQFPEYEGFDKPPNPSALTNLPLGWRGTHSGTSTPTVRLAQPSTTSHPRPASWYFAASIETATATTTETVVALISPKVQDLRSKRVSFHATCTATATSLPSGRIQVGYFTDSDAFVPLQEFVIPSNGTTSTIHHNFSVCFDEVPEGNYSIGFRSVPNGSSSRVIRVDDVLIEEIPPVAQLVFNPSQTPTTLDFGTFLWGQYREIKHYIVNAGGADLSVLFYNSTPGLTISPSEFTLAPKATQEITYRYSGVTEGALSGTVAMTSNDLTNEVIVFNLSANVTAVEGLTGNMRQIGNGSSVANTSVAPWYPPNFRTVSQSLYFPNELNMVPGTKITKVAYQFNGASALTQNVEVYMGHTDKVIFAASAAANWVPFTQMQNVFSGQANTSTTVGSWVEIELDTPFIYNGRDNLVVGVYNESGSAETGVFYNEAAVATDTYSATTNYPTATQGYTNTTAINLLNLPALTQRAWIPNTRFSFDPPSVEAAIAVTPSTLRFASAAGTFNIPKDATVPNRQIVVTNTSMEPVTITDVDLFDIDGVFTKSHIELPHTLVNPSDTFVINVSLVNTTVADSFYAVIAIIDDISRQITTVPVIANIKDYSITNDMMPYTENFNNEDGWFVPNLPISWGTIIQSTASASAITTTTSNSTSQASGTPPAGAIIANPDGSAPNNLLFTQSTDREAILIAYTPYIADITEKTVKFKIRAQQVDYSGIEIGSLSIPGDINTYEPIAEFRLEHRYYYFDKVCNLASAQGNYLAFKFLPTLSGGTGATLHLNDVVIIETPLDPTIAFDSAVNFGTFFVNQIGTGYLTMFNQGSGLLIVEHVPSTLFSASPAVVEIPANGSQRVVYSFTPSATGTHNNAAMIPITTNDPTKLTYNIPINATVQEHTLGPNIMQIGSETNDTNGSYLPYESYYKMGYSQAIYLVNELQRPTTGTPETITKISYQRRASFSETNNLRIYMGYTDEINFGVPPYIWIDHDDLFLVHEAEVDRTGADNTWLDIPLQVPFPVDPNRNLVVAVASSQGNTTTTNTASFRSSAVTTGIRMRGRARSGADWIDLSDFPNNIGSSSRSAMEAQPRIPNTRFEFGEMQEYSLLVTPLDYDFGTVGLGYPDHIKPKMIRLFNNGQQSVTISGIDYSGDNHTEFSHVMADPTLTIPFTLNSMETKTFMVYLNALTEGPKSATITITHNIPSGSPEEITLTGNVIDYDIDDFPYSENFDTVTTPALPAGWTVVNTTSNPGQGSRFVRTVSNSGTLVNYPYPSHLTTTNAMYLHNINTTNPATGHLMAVSPVIGDVSNKLLGFWGRGEDSLWVGTVTDHLDPDTWEYIATVQLGRNWSYHLIDLRAGTGNRLAFRHPLSHERTASLYIDDIMVTEIGVAPYFFTLNTNVDFGRVVQSMPKVKYIDIKNLGGTELELWFWPPAEITMSHGTDAVRIAPDSTVTVGFILSAPQTGDYTSSIEITTNDPDNTTVYLSASAFAIEEPPFGQIQIGAGDPSLSSNLYYHNLPMYRENTHPSWRSMTQTIIHAGELSLIPDGEALKMIAYQHNGAGGAWRQDIQIYATYTDKTHFVATGSDNSSSDWIPISQQTLIYSGEMLVNSAGSPHWVVIDFDSGRMVFPHQAGRNLVITFVDVDSENETAGYFVADIRDEFRSIGNSSIVAQNINNPSNGTIRRFIPNMRLRFDTPPPLTTITGTITGSDLPGVGIENAVIYVNGAVADTTNALGQYELANIYVNEPYDILIKAEGYFDSLIVEQRFMENEVLDIQLEWIPKWTLTGTVYSSIDLDNGLEGVVVYLNNAIADTTDADGKYALPNLIIDDTYNLRFEAEDHFPKAYPNYLIEWDDTLDVVLDYSLITPLVGKVTNINIPDVGLPGVVVYLNNAIADTTNAEGWYEIPDLVVSLIYRISFEARGYQTVTYGQYQVSRMDDTLNVAMTPIPNTTVVGKITGSDAPEVGLAGAIVNIDNVPTATTNADGRFELPDLVIDASYRLEFIAPGYISEVVDYVAVFEDSLHIVLEWNPFMTLVGQVTGSNAPEVGLAGVIVSLDETIVDTTDEDGYYEIPNLLRGETYRLDFTAPGYQAYEVTDYVATFGDTLDIEMIWIPVTTLVGRVTGEDTDGAGLAGVIVSLNEAIADTTDALGWFEIPNLVIGETYRLDFTRADYDSLTIFEYIAVEDDTIHIVLLPEGETEQEDLTLPVITTLGSNYPNPFNPSTTIEFAIRNTEFGMNNVSIEIFNIKGQKVRSLVNGNFSSGTHRVVWNGNDDNGRPVSSGIYFYRMRTEGYVATKKMILMK